MRMRTPPHRPDPREGETARIRAAFSAVPESVKGLLVETLMDWLEAAREEGADHALQEWIDEINRAFASKRNLPSVLAKGFAAALDAETREFRRASIEAEPPMRERAQGDDDSARRIWHEQQAAGKRYRDIMSHHRVGRTGHARAGVMQKI